MTADSHATRLARWLMTALAGVAAAGLGWGLSSPAMGITACGGVLRDGDDLIPAAQEPHLASVTDATQLAGAQPLIVLLRTSGGRNMQAELNEAITTCPALVEDPGQVIAVGIATDDQTVLVQPGVDLAGRLHTEDITNLMRDQIGRVPLEQVLANGFNEINHQLYDTRNDQPAKPIFSPTAWGALGVLLLLLAGVGAVWVVQHRHALKAAKAEAEAARERGMVLALHLERDQKALEKQTQDLAEWIALSEVEPISRAQVEINLRTHSVLRAWHGIITQMGTAEGFSAEAYGRYTERLHAAYDDLQDAADHMMRTQGQVAQVISVIDGLDGRLAAMPSEFAAAQAAINAAKTKGWITDAAQRDLEVAQSFAQWAQKARDRQEMLGADEFLRVAESKATACTNHAQQIERTFAEMTQQVTAAERRHQALTQSLAPARDAMAGLAEAFAQRSWESVAGNGSTAEAILATVPEQIAQVRTRLDRSVQDVDQAESGLKTVNAAMDTAEALIDAIHETLADLQHAATLLPDAIRAADRAVETAVQVAQARENADGIAVLKQMGERIHRERQYDKPDLRALIDAAELLTLQADQWVVEKQGDQALEASIARAARSGVDQARVRCTQAARLVMTHRNDLPESYSQVMEELAEHLDEVVAEPDPSKQLDLATKIRHQAISVEQEARRVLRTQARVKLAIDAQSRW